MGDPVAVQVPIAFLPKEVLDLLHAVLPCSIELKQFPHHRGLRFVDHQALVVLFIAEDAAVAQHNLRFDGLLMAEFHAAGKLAQLVLGDARHDRQAQLRILVQRIDVVVLKENRYAVAQQLAGILYGIQRVAGKARDLLGDDHVEPAILAVLDHSVEILALSGGYARKAFVHIAFHEGPRRVFPNQVFIIRPLIGQRIQLFIGIRRHAGIECHPHGDFINRPGPKHLPGAQYIHNSLQKVVISCLYYIT